MGTWVNFENRIEIEKESWDNGTIKKYSYTE